MSFGLMALLVCGALLLQAGCQQGASETKSPAAQTQQTAPAAEKPAAPATATPASTETKEAPAQSAAEAKPQTTGGTPKIEFKATTQNFGDIGPETAHTTKFEFKNAGNAPLRILRIKACCGSVTRGVKVGQEFAPGESGALEVEYRPGNYPGPQSRNISMDTNDPEQPTSSLTIKLNVVYKIEHSPNAVSLFPRKDNAACPPITIKSIDGQAFSIKGFRATANTLTAEFDPNAKATEFVLKPKADAEKLARNNRGQIVVTMDHPECASITIPFDVIPEFSITPQQLTLFNVKAGQPVQRDVWIMSNYGEDFEIESTSSQKGTVKVIETKKIPAAPAADAAAATPAGGMKNGTRYQLRVEVTPPAQEDKRTILSDILEVKIKGGETVTIQCRGIYAAS